MHSITHSLIKALKAVPGFDALDEAYLLEIAGASVNLKWPAGSMVFTKGSPADAVYILLSGCVRIYDDFGDAEMEIARIGPGQYFGEMALLLDTTHTKNASAEEETELMVLSKDSFGSLLESNPSLDAQIRETSEARRSETEEKYQTGV